MATVRDIVSRALKKIGVVGKGENMAAEDAEDGVSALNEMLSAWKLRGVDITHTDLTLTSTFPLADEYREGTIHLLAAALSPEYRFPVGFDPDRWFRNFQAAYSTVPTLTIPKALTRPPSFEDREQNFPLTTT